MQHDVAKPPSYQLYLGDIEARLSKMDRPCRAEAVLAKSTNASLGVERFAEELSDKLNELEDMVT